MSRRPTSDARNLYSSRPEGRLAKGPSGPKTSKRIRGVRVLSTVDAVGGARHVTFSLEFLGLQWRARLLPCWLTEVRRLVSLLPKALRCSTRRPR